MKVNIKYRPLPMSQVFRSVRFSIGMLIFACIFMLLPSGLSQTGRIQFWTQPHGDLLSFQNLMRDFAAEFADETGITVQVEVIPWNVAFNTWLTVAQGGAHPDSAEMYWLHSFSRIGGDQYGPMPINEFKDVYWPDLEERFFPGSLVDVFWQGDFYGVPMRGDIRPMIYRTDILAEHGLTEPPDSWEEIVEYALQLTERDARGNVSRWGFTFGGSNPVQNLMSYYWQAGGSFMSEDGTTATIDNEQMRITLEWARDLVWVHEVVSPEFMERGFDAQADFVSGNVAMVGSVSDAWGETLEREFPELDGLWAMAINPQGPENRASYSGAGYWGVLRGSQNVEDSIRWIAFLSREENLQRFTEVTGRVSPDRNVMASDYWTERPWRQVVAQTLEHARTSQHPSPAWSTIAHPEPGAVLYDMFYDAIIQQQNIDEVVARAQQRMQEALDRGIQ
jgi:multiple sugar transport system substrate-binding protein